MSVLSPGEILDGLRIMPNIVECSVIKSIDKFPNTGQTVTMHSLQSLNLGKNNRGLPFFIDSLVLPQLAHVCINDTHDCLLLVTSILSLVSRSHYSLQAPTLFALIVKADELLRVLKTVSSLKELEVDWIKCDDDCAFNDDVVAYLTWGPSDIERPLPNLCTLRLWGAMKFEDENLVDMIQSRWYNVPTNCTKFRQVGLLYTRSWEERLSPVCIHSTNKGLDSAATTSEDMAAKSQ